jgi:hypothetical protein
MDDARTLGSKRIFFGFDEMHGFNRDSRSKALGKGNFESLAFAINRLQGFMHQEDPTARAMVWADMLCPFHNGGRPHYQVHSHSSTRHGTPVLYTDALLRACNVYSNIAVALRARRGMRRQCLTSG